MKKAKIVSGLAAVAVAVALAVLVSCGGTDTENTGAESAVEFARAGGGLLLDERLFGRWQITSRGAGGHYFFDNDGTGFASITDSGMTYETEFAWSTADGRLTLTVQREIIREFEIGNADFEMIKLYRTPNPAITSDVMDLGVVFEGRHVVNTSDTLNLALPGVFVRERSLGGIAGEWSAIAGNGVLNFGGDGSGWFGNESWNLIVPFNWSMEGNAISFSADGSETYRAVLYHVSETLLHRNSGETYGIVYAKSSGPEGSIVGTWESLYSGSVVTDSNGLPSIPAGNEFDIIPQGSSSDTFRADGTGIRSYINVHRHIWMESSFTWNVTGGGLTMIVDTVRDPNLTYSITGEEMAWFGLDFNVRDNLAFVRVGDGR